MAVHRDVHLWLPHPSPGLWDTVAGAASGVGDRRADPTAVLPRHPLVSSLGRDARELQLMLRDTVPTAELRHHPWDVAPTTLLGRLQRDLAADRPPAADLALDGRTGRCRCTPATAGCARSR